MLLLFHCGQMVWNNIASEEELERTSKSLESRGIEVIIANSREDAKRKVMSLIPKGAEVMAVSSVTLDETGISSEIENGDYVSVKKAVMSLNDDAQRAEARRKSSHSEYVVGSVHAVTQDGQVLVASGSGSQLPFYTYSSKHVIWVVGTQKIVRNLDDAMKRLYEYILPLESERIRKVYPSMSGSSVNKVLIFEKERPGRIKLVFVKERLGF